MNLVGKIFTVLILVMSIAFMMLAVTVFATHRNWRDVVMEPGGLKERIEQLASTNELLRAESERTADALAREQVTRRYALASLETQLQISEQEQQTLAQQFAELSGQHGTIVETLNTNGNILENQERENTELRDQLRVSQEARDDTFLRIREIADQLNAIEGKMRVLSERREQLKAQVARMQVVLDRNDLSEFMVSDLPPRVDGVVTAVSSTDLIEISIGSDDGLRQGHTLEVFRQNSYVGRVVIQETMPDKSVARIIPEFRKGIIRRGDRVATKLI